MEVIPGNPEANLVRILRGIDDAAAAGAALVVFPEMALPGYLLGDEWENDAFLRDLEGMNDRIVAHTAGRCAAAWDAHGGLKANHSSLALAAAWPSTTARRSTRSCRVMDAVNRQDAAACRQSFGALEKSCNDCHFDGGVGGKVSGK